MMLSDHLRLSVCIVVSALLRSEPSALMMITYRAVRLRSPLNMKV